MRFSLLGAVVGVVLMASGAIAEEEVCRAPFEPDMPDHFKTMDEAVAANKAAIKYVTDSEIYLNCLDFRLSKIDEDADDAAEKRSEIATDRNANVDTQNALKNRFGATYKKYKEEHPE